jgi:NitT/TauT family transport system ATP-binding protein
MSRSSSFTAKAAIWKSSPEKVLGVSAQWAACNPEALDALLRALYRAAEWCAQPANHPELARLLASRQYVDCPAG